MAINIEGVEAALREQIFRYLDDLRSSGIVNMLGSGPYLEAEFGLTGPEAQTILVEWMKTFGERHPLPGEEQP